jgi:hypothetical protein
MLFIIHFYLRTLNVESACGGSKREKSNKKNWIEGSKRRRKKKGENTVIKEKRKERDSSFSYLPMYLFYLNN